LAKQQAGQHARPSRRRWRSVAVVAAAVVLLGGGYATANAATGAGGKRPPARPQIPHATGVGAVVNAANAFLDTLSADQQATVLLEFSQANATAWSNLPEGIVTRPGIQFGTLSDPQLAAAKAVVKAAMGTGKGTGFDQATQILKADDILADAGSTGTGSTTGPSAAPSDVPSGTPPSGGPGGPGGGGFNYGSGVYFLAFLGTPSTRGTWQLHFGGHHLAVNITFEDGRVTGSTPFFIGVEPTSFTTDGTTYQPLSIMRDGLLKLTGSLTAAQRAKAELTESFGDVLLGPGQDGRFPTTKQGVPVAQLSPQQKKLVLAAIYPWVAAVDDATAKMLMRSYESELNQTYVAYSGGLGLDTQGDYVRIDGPGVWVEFICQNGIVFQSQIHFHTVYRDHTRDYGGEFTF